MNTDVEHGSMNFFKVYGLKRSGTNYAQWLINNNFENCFNLINYWGWKHGLPIIDKSNDSCEHSRETSRVYKHKWENRCAPYVQEIEESHSNNTLKYVFCVKNPYSWLYSMRKAKMNPQLKRWNDVNRAYVEFHENNPECSFIVRFEDHYGGFSHVLERMRTQFSLDMSHVQYVNQDFIIGANQKVQDVGFDLSFYEREEYMDSLSKKDLTRIQENVDHELINKLE